MTFTFSDNREVDYPALGMCDTCGKRFTQGCEHSNTLESQEWLAAYAAVETSRANVEHYLKSVEQPHPAQTAYAMEGTYPSPIISGGEVLESYAVAIDPDEPPADMADDFPF